MKARIDVDAWKISGPDDVSCKLEAFIEGEWKHIKGDDPTAIDRDNGVFMLRSIIVDLCPKTKVRWVRDFSRDGRASFEGTWRQLCEEPQTPFYLLGPQL
jgi:hypothetical protein